MHLSALLILSLSLSAPSFAGEVPSWLTEKVAAMAFDKQCWGEQNVRGWYQAVEAAVDKCQQLTPTFDIDVLGDSNSNDNNNNNNYPVGGRPPLPPPPTQFLAARRPRPDILNNFASNNNVNNVNGLQGFNSPYEAWLAFLAFQQASQAGQQVQQQQVPRRRMLNWARNRFTRDTKEQEIMEFMSSLETYKGAKKEMIGNLTCVLADLGALDEDLNVNMRWYLNDVWQEMAEPLDADFQSKLISGYGDCFTLSNAVPQSLLDKNPVASRFGRHMVFFKCTQKMEKSLCTKKALVSWLEESYVGEKITPGLLRRVGLPEDKYEAAVVALKVIKKSKPDSAKYVYKKLFGGNK